MGRYIEVEKHVKLFVEDVAPGNGKPILFVHGWPLNHNMYEYQFNQLPKKGYRCIGVDLRGFGKSDRPWEGYDYNRMADDLRAVIDAMGLEHITLAGFSMGGAIAIRYMARHAAHQISKLVLLGAAAPVFTRRPDFPQGLPKDQVNKLIVDTYTDRPKMVEAFGDLLFARYVTDSFKRWIRTLCLEASGHATAMCLASLRDEDLRQDLGRIHTPTAIFHGVHDQICPFPLAQAMHAGIRGSELVPFANSGHGLFYCEKDKLNQELIRFI